VKAARTVVFSVANLLESGALNANEAAFQRGGALPPIRIINNWQILRLTRAAELPQLGLNWAGNRSFSNRTGGAIYGRSGLEISRPRGAAGRRVV